MKKKESIKFKEVLINTFRQIKEKPKIMLLFVIAWIPAIISEMLTQQAFINMLVGLPKEVIDYSFMLQTSMALRPETTLILVFKVIQWTILALLIPVFVNIVHNFKQKNVLMESLKQTKKNFKNIALTIIAIVLIMIPILIGYLYGITYMALNASTADAQTQVVIGTIIIGLLITILPSMILWQAIPHASIKNAGPIESIRKSFKMFKEHAPQTLLSIFLIYIIAFLYVEVTQLSAITILLDLIVLPVIYLIIANFYKTYTY